MMAEPQDLQQRMEQLKERLQQAGVKATHQRLEVFRQVVCSAEHPDAETVYNGVRERMPTISLDTVYRTLWLLKDLGLISMLGASGDRARFDANLDTHHHFVCSQCGMTRDFYSADLDQITIPESARSFGRVESAHVEVRGVCAECARQNNP